MKAAELREFMAPIDRDSLPTIDKAEEIIEDRKLLAHEAHADAMLEKAYARGDDYVSQTMAALEDNKRRQPINDEPRPERPSEPSPDARRIQEIIEASDRSRHDTNESSSARDSAKKRSDEERVASKFDNVEMTEAQQQRMQRLLNNPDSGRDYDENYERDPDRQQETPGGGHTRGR